MSFRDLDATKAVRELRVGVRCKMTARTSACRIASRKLGKQEPGKLSFCAPELEFVSSAWQLLVPSTEESQSIKICCVAWSRPRGGHVRLREERVCWGNGGRGLLFSTQTLNLRTRAPRRDPWSTLRRETRFVPSSMRISKWCQESTREDDDPHSTSSHRVSDLTGADTRCPSK